MIIIITTTIYTKGHRPSKEVEMGSEPRKFNLEICAHVLSSPSPQPLYIQPLSHFTMIQNVSYSAFMYYFHLF